MTGEIRVETTFKADKEDVAAVISGVKSMTNDVGLDPESFRFINCGEDATATKAVKDATCSNGLDSTVLFGTLEYGLLRDPSQKGKPHADIIITDVAFVDAINLGATKFNPGLMVISIPGNILKSRKFLFNLGKHEAGHLFGFDSHHKELSVDMLVKGYPEVAECSMEWACLTSVICDECKDPLISFWQGVEKQTGLKFLRTS